MGEQEKTQSVYSLLKQLEDSLTKETAELKEKVEEYKKRAQESREQHLPKQYQDQCDEVATAFDGLLGGMLADLELVKQAKANLQ